MQDELLTVGEVAGKLGVSIRTVQRYCKQGLLNHKWIHGRRHRELRIVPPIPLSLLPGVKHGSALAEGDFISREDYDSLAATLTRELARRDERIEALERQLSEADSGAARFLRADAPRGADTEILDRAEALVRELERVRPVEKKLILALARTVKKHEEFLATLGFEKDEE
jgi:hypothetical protein